MQAPTSQAIAEAVTEHRAAAVSLFAQLANGGLPGAGVTRDPYGAGENRGHDVVSNCPPIGMEINRDVAANPYMTLPGRDRRRETRHCRLASRLGSAWRQFRRRRRRGGRPCRRRGAARRSASALERDLTVMGIRAEESIWFQVSYIGSRGALGMLPDGALDVRRIDTGRTLAEHIAECGGDPDALRAGARFLDPARIAAYLELAHRAGAEPRRGGTAGRRSAPASPATSAIPTRASKAATTMSACRAASAATPRWRVPSSPWRSTVCGNEHEAKGVPMACTIGRFHTDTATHGLTIVPGAFHFSLDVRAYDEAVLAELDRQVDAIIAGIEQRRGVRFHRGPKARAAVGAVDPVDQVGAGACAAELDSPCCNSAVLPRMTPPPLPPPGCRWA